MGPGNYPDCEGDEDVSQQNVNPDLIKGVIIKGAR